MHCSCLKRFLPFSTLIILSLTGFSQPRNSGSARDSSILTITSQHVPAEVTVTSAIIYSDPYNELMVDALVKGPRNQVQRIPAFWAGGNSWKFRYSNADTGSYSWKIEATNPKDASLKKIHGVIRIVPYTGNATLYRSGALQVSADKRHFQFADGKPFLWLGDTWWKGLSKRISFDDFKTLTANRKSRGFNVIQIIAGPYPDEPPFDPRWANEGGMPYIDNYARINPVYFDSADKRIKHLLDEGLMPSIVGGWGWHMEKVGVENFVRHWRYLIARYGAYPVTWIVGGEAGEKEWTDVARKVREMDPYHRLVTMHSFPGSGRMYLTDETVLDFDMLQTGHGGFYGANSPYGAWNATAANTASKIMAAYSKTPAMPVLIGEVTYEGHMRTNGPEVQRQQFWTSLLSGAAGHTYGAGGIWQMNSTNERGAEYEFTPWHEAMELPGATQLGKGRRLLEEYDWWKFQQHPEWVDPHATTLTEPHAEWYDDSTRYAQKGQRWDLPYAAGIPGKVRFIYIPGHYYDWSAPVIKNLEPGVPYHTFLVDPSSGIRYSLGVVVNGKQTPAMTSSIHQGLQTLFQENQDTESNNRKVKPTPLVLNENPRIFPASSIPSITWLTSSDYKPARLPAPQDWLLVMEKIGD